ncbi:MAG: YicC/YloC family endoribonuclease [Oscillospiraceae bacterium]|nr:YicC/YloC family endoribonuclease [Oscillospiraceae bacterium]
MIRSMTGYGRGRAELNGRDITVEIRSVNNRFLDCTVKMPHAYAFAEDAVKTRIKGGVARGKLDVYVTILSIEADKPVIALNESVAESYISALRQLRDKYDLRDDISVMNISRFPDVFSVTKEEEDVESLTADICSVLDSALENYTAMRETEGEKLKADIEGRLDTILDFTSKVEERSPETVSKYRERLEAKMREVLENNSIDESRIVTEAAILADKIAVDEETVRLRSHVSQLRGMLEEGGAIGRKADFLIQEFNREANTIGSKCTDLDISKVVVNIKAEIEKIREQVQNIE